MPEAKVVNKIDSSKYISRDLSWLKFNHRVLDQALDPNRTLFERMKFLAITESNLDEFFMIRIRKFVQLYWLRQKRELIIPV